MNDVPAEQPDDQLMREAALGHLSMIFQVATGLTTESHERTERRYLALTQYVLNQTCAVSPDERPQLAQLHDWLSTQFAPQPITAATNAA